MKLKQNYKINLTSGTCRTMSMARSMLVLFMSASSVVGMEMQFNAIQVTRCYNDLLGSGLCLDGRVMEVTRIVYGRSIPQKVGLGGRCASAEHDCETELELEKGYYQAVQSACNGRRGCGNTYIQPEMFWCEEAGVLAVPTYILLTYNCLAVPTTQETTVSNEASTQFPQDSTVTVDSDTTRQEQSTSIYIWSSRNSEQSTYSYMTTHVSSINETENRQQGTTTTGPDIVIIAVPVAVAVVVIIAVVVLVVCLVKRRKKLSNTALKKDDLPMVTPDQPRSDLCQEQDTDIQAYSTTSNGREMDTRTQSGDKMEDNSNGTTEQQVHAPKSYLNGRSLPETGHGKLDQSVQNPDNMIVYDTAMPYMYNGVNHEGEDDTEIDDDTYVHSARVHDVYSDVSRTTPKPIDLNDGSDDTILVDNHLYG